MKKIYLLIIPFLFTLPSAVSAQVYTRTPTGTTPIPPILLNITRADLFDGAIWGGSWNVILGLGDQNAHGITSILGTSQCFTSSSQSGTASISMGSSIAVDLVAIQYFANSDCTNLNTRAWVEGGDTSSPTVIFTTGEAIVQTASALSSIIDTASTSIQQSFGVSMTDGVHYMRAQLWFAVASFLGVFEIVFGIAVALLIIMLIVRFVKRGNRFIKH